jgi:hypothetical protein
MLQKLGKTTLMTIHVVLCFAVMLGSTSLIVLLFLIAAMAAESADTGKEVVVGKGKFFEMRVTATKQE